jgi:hypothetical protein
MKRVVRGFICAEHFSISFHLILSLHIYLVWFLFSKGYGLVEGREEKREARKGQLGHYTYRVFANVRNFNFIPKAYCTYSPSLSRLWLET